MTPEELNAQEQQLKPKRKLRLWVWIVLIILLFIIGLIALAPTIAGTSPIRSIIVKKINENINGSAEIADLSFSWFGSARISGIKVYSPDKRLILDIPQIRLGISVLDALRQKFALGDNNQIDIASFVLSVDENGKTNFEQLLKAQPKTPKAPTTSPTSPKT
ncbi:MAG TPA: AsmA family protein, partial [Tepidisphaeraceae bacterium]|nr:AsmA family protein [Tepidisphaeraceae bacterium]